MARRKKYGTKDEVLTKATGMNKDERQAFRNDVDYWMDIRRNNPVGSKKRIQAEKKINSLMGW